MQARQQCPDPEQRDGNVSGQPLVTMGGGGLALALADAGAASNAYRNESRDQSKLANMARRKTQNSPQI